MNKECYTLKKKIYNNYLFNNVDATYIIHLENNGRINNINKQLLLYHPTNIIYILYNKGFRKCEKEEYIDMSSLDLIDAFFQIFMHAKLNNYNNILILEDDFIFDKNINDLLTINEIDSFLFNHKNDNFIYYLGMITYLQISNIFYHTNKLIFSTGTHSCIYSNKFINDILKVDKKKIIDWDVYLNFNYTRYTYYKPLCYQIFLDTENFKSWHRNNTYLKYICNFQSFCRKILLLDVQVYPGYEIMYYFSKIIFYVFIFLIFYIIYKIIYFYKKKKVDYFNLERYIILLI